MSAVEIINELSTLTTEERSAVRRRLRELDEQDELLFLHESADAMFQNPKGIPSFSPALTRNGYAGAASKQSHQP